MENESTASESKASNESGKSKGIEVKAKMKASKVFEKARQNPWIVVSVILAVLLVGLAGFSFLNPAEPTGLATGVSSTQVDKQALASKALNYLKVNYFDAQGVIVSLKSTEEVNNGLVVAKFELIKDGQTQLLDAFLTADGKQMIIPQGVLELDKPVEIPEPAEMEEEILIPKNDKPVLELFVMSFCPFGKQAEQGLFPVLELLGDSVEFNLRFVASKNGSDFASLHGAEELNEGVRQLCVQKNFKEKLLDYVNAINELCTLQNVNECWKTAAEKAGIDIDEVEKCALEEKTELLDAEIVLNELYSVTGSPTLIINGELYSGGRSSENYKQAVCSAFNNPPEECSQTLDANSGQASGSC